MGWHNKNETGNISGMSFIGPRQAPLLQFGCVKCARGGEGQHVYNVHFYCIHALVCVCVCVHACCVCALVCVCVCACLLCVCVCAYKTRNEYRFRIIYTRPLPPMIRSGNIIIIIISRSLWTYATKRAGSWERAHRKRTAHSPNGYRSQKFNRSTSFLMFIFALFARTRVLRAGRWYSGNANFTNPHPVRVCTHRARLAI